MVTLNVGELEDLTLCTSTMYSTFKACDDILGTSILIRGDFELIVRTSCSYTNLQSAYFHTVAVSVITLECDSLQQLCPNDDQPRMCV